LSFTLSSKWEHKALGVIGDSQAVSAADSIFQLAAGVSVNQPILNRRSWGGTDPLELSAKVRFLAREYDSAKSPGQVKADVYDKVVALSTLLIPRIAGSVTGFEGMLSAYIIPGPSPFGGKAAASVAKAFKQEDIGYGGDAVTVAIGSKNSPLVYLKQAYIMKMQAIFTKALGPDGYPLGAEVTITFGSMDTPMLSADQDGNIQGLSQNNVLLNSAYANTEITDAIMNFSVAATSFVAKKAESLGTWLKNAGDGVEGGTEFDPAPDPRVAYPLDPK